MKKNENKEIKTKYISDNEKHDRERVHFSLSYRRIEEATIAVIFKKKYKIRINDQLSISGAMLFKYFITKGLEEVDKKYGQIREIKKLEGIIDGNDNL